MAVFTKASRQGRCSKYESPAMPIASEKATSACAAAKWRATRQAKCLRDSGGGLRGSYMSCPPSGREDHERDDCDVESEGRDPYPGDVARELVELARDVDAAAHRGGPFPPGA